LGEDEKREQPGSIRKTDSKNPIATRINNPLSKLDQATELKVEPAGVL
jgi:hypothetical protein